MKTDKELIILGLEAEIKKTYSDISKLFETKNYENIPKMFNLYSEILELESYLESIYPKSKEIPF